MVSADHIPRRALVARLRNYVGDVVLSIPALEALDAAGFDLHLFGKPWAKDLLAAYPWAVHSFSADFLPRTSALRACARALRTQDATFSKRVNALTFVTAFSSALDLRFAGLKAAGYRTEGRGFLLSKHAPLDDSVHAIDAYWGTAKILCPTLSAAPDRARLKVHPRHETEAHARLAAAGVTSPYVVLVPYPGGEINGESKSWPHFRALVATITEGGFKIVMAPSDSESEFTRTHFPEAASLEKISLGAYAAVLRGAVLTIANDTGPGHMAASVGGRLLSILGPTPQSLWAARGPHVTILQGSPGWPDTEHVRQTLLEQLSLQRAAHGS